MHINKLESLLEKEGIVFLTYGGFLTQSLVVGMTEALEKESENADISMKLANNIFTIFIELSQNMMNYSKSLKQNGQEFDPKGMIVVGKNKDGYYYIMSQNIININDKNKIEEKLNKIISTDLEGVKQLYKEARRSGKDMHGKGGGIGFYEIAKRASKIEYDFSSIDDNKFYFKFKAIL